MKPTSVHFSMISLYRTIFLLAIGCTPSVWGQISIENKIPQNVPIKVEFKHQDSENWVHDLEIKVTNVGKKPIYYLDLLLILDVKTKDGVAKGFTFQFGNGKTLYSTEGVAQDDDPAILPNQIYIFKNGSNTATAWDLGKKRLSFIKPQSAEFDLGWLSFGDGTGIAGGGVPYKKKTDL